MTGKASTAKRTGRADSDKHRRLAAIPKELRSRPQWVVWGIDKDRPKKPYNPATMVEAKAGRPETWGTFEQAAGLVLADRAEGVGFEFNLNGLVGIDLDTVRDPQTGFVDPAAEAIIEAIGSYTEISPSGCGFHIIAGADGEDIPLGWNKSKLPENGIERPDTDPATGRQRVNARTGEPVFKRPEIEVYTQGRYFTVTGEVYNGLTDINQRRSEIMELLSKHAPKRGRPTSGENSRNTPDEKDYLQTGLSRDARFRSAWNGARPHGDESSDDLALMNRLAYWCGCDADAMIKAFLSSPYAAQKDQKHWKKAAERGDYLRRTAAVAIRDCAQTARERDMLHTAPRRSANRTGIKKSLEFMKIFQPTETVPELLEYDLNDTGNTRRFFHLYAEHVRFSREVGAWYIWNGQKWEQDLTGKIYRMGITAAMTYKLTASERYRNMLTDFSEFEADPQKWRENHGGEEPQDPKTFKPVMRHANISGMAARIHSAIDEAGQAAFITQAELDRHRHLLTCTNGTVNLKTGELTEHNPDLFITRMADESYDREAKAPIFTAFLRRIFDGDNELTDYVQKVLGYCITGETREQCFFIGYGLGANGKTTLIEAVSDVITEHTHTIPTSVLMDKEQGREGSTSPELAQARGARLVIASESRDINSLNEAQIKQLTGGDAIFARPLYSQGFRFRPNFKIWLSTNHKPKIRGVDNGIWRRVHLIPFAVTIPEDEQDPALPEKLKSERSGILTWLIEGARRYYAEGIAKPDAVKKATDEYRSEMDLIGGFLDDCAVTVPDGIVSARALYNAFRGYCDDNGVPPMSVTTFGRKMGEKGFSKKKISVFYYQGIELSERGMELAEPSSAFIEAPPPDSAPFSLQYEQTTVGGR